MMTIENISRGVLADLCVQMNQRGNTVECRSSQVGLSFSALNSEGKRRTVFIRRGTSMYDYIGTWLFHPAKCDPSKSRYQVLSSDDFWAAIKKSIKRNREKLNIEHNGQFSYVSKK